MINFQSPEDIQFACDTIREELQFKHERTGKNIFTLEEMNAHLIAEGLFDSQPSIPGISEFDWQQNRALLSLIKVVQNMGKAEAWLPNLNFNSQQKPFFTHPCAVAASEPFTAPPQAPQRSEERTAKSISSSSRKAYYLKKLKRVVNRTYYDRTAENLALVMDTFEDMMDFLTALPSHTSNIEQGKTNAEQLEEIRAIVDSWPLEKKDNLPQSVIERRVQHRRFVEPWSDQELELLEMAYEITTNRAKLADLFGRSEASIEFKLEELYPPSE